MKKIYMLLSFFLIITFLIFYIFLINKPESNILQNNISENEKIFTIIGEHYPPYYFTENNTVKGINADIYKYIFNKLGIKIEMETYPWARAIKMLQNGYADAVDSTSYTRERESYLYFSEEQKTYKSDIPDFVLWTTDMVFFVNKNTDINLKENFTLNDVKKARFKIAVIRDYSYYKEFWESELNIKIYAKNEYAFKALADKEVDLFILDRTVGQYIVNTMELKDDISYLKQVLYRKPYYLVFSKKSEYPGLLSINELFNLEIKKFMKTDEYKEIYRRYMLVSE